MISYFCQLSFLAILFFLSYMFLLSSRYLHRWVYSAAMLLLSFNIGVTLWAEPTIFQQFAFYSSFFFVLVLANFAYGLANSNMRCDSFKSLMIINKLSKLL